MCPPTAFSTATAFRHLGTASSGAIRHSVRSTGLVPWLEKFIAHGDGICLTPDATSTVWFHDAVAQVDAVLFTRGRIKHEREDGSLGNKGPTSGHALLGIGPRARATLIRAQSNALGSLLTVAAKPPSIHDRREGTSMPVEEHTMADDFIASLKKHRLPPPGRYCVRIVPDEPLGVEEAGKTTVLVFTVAIQAGPCAGQRIRLRFLLRTGIATLTGFLARDQRLLADWAEAAGIATSDTATNFAKELGRKGESQMTFLTIEHRKGSAGTVEIVVTGVEVMPAFNVYD